MSAVSPILMVVSIAIAASLGLLTAVTIRRPLLNILSQLCGTNERGRFWTAYTMAFLVLAPTFGAICVLAFPPTTTIWSSFLARVLFASTSFLILALLATGWSIWRPAAAAMAVVPPDIDTAAPEGTT